MSVSPLAHTGAGRNGKKASQEEGRASVEDQWRQSAGTSRVSSSGNLAGV